jgi:hypothetical protein
MYIGGCKLRERKEKSMEIVTLLGTIMAIIASGISVYIALKKTKPEIEGIETESDKNKAEIVAIYAEELRKLKEENKKERQENQQKIVDLEKRVSDLNGVVNQQIVDRKQEQLKYREFINELLLGITMLTGQIQIKGETPVWIPPAKIPFEDN